MRVTAPAIFTIALATSAAAGPVTFSQGWKEQRLKLFSSNDYSFGRDLGVVSDGSVSIAWSRVGQADWDTSGASWNWSVAQSVPPTNLARKGGDDRNLAMYFVFVPQSEAAAVSRANIRSLLGNKDVRIIQYTWGGNTPRGQIISSPYGPSGQGVTIPLRQASTGSHSERVDLTRDYARAFGGTKGALVGLAVSGDSDDTNSVIRASIGNLSLQ